MDRPLTEFACVVEDGSAKVASAHDAEMGICPPVGLVLSVRRNRAAAT